MDLIFNFDSGSDGDDEHEEDQQEELRRNSDSSNSSNESVVRAPTEAREGRKIYLEMVREGINQNGLNDPPFLLPGEGSWSPHWDRYDFHDLLLEVSISTQGEEAKQEAQKIQLDSLDYKAFYAGLEVIFEDDDDMETIAASFLYSVDLAIRALKEGHREKFDLVLEWTLKYISTQVAPFVRRQGGW